MLSHLILPNMIIEIMDIKRAYPYGSKKEFCTIVELQSTQGTLEINMPFAEFKQKFVEAISPPKEEKKNA